MSVESTPPTTVAARRTFWFRRRSIPLPTWRTWFVVLSSIGIASWLLLPRVHAWLAVIEPLDKPPYMIVEGWLPDYALEEAMADANGQPVRRIFTTGIPLERGTFLSGFRDYATLSAASLAKMGINSELICPVPSNEVNTERTRAMARALKKVLDAENIPAAERRINLYTLGAHGRRSARIYRDVLGSSWQVGVISVPSKDYDETKWYRKSSGAKSVLSELVALTVQSGDGD